jgi:hypothetical protein
MLPLLVRVLALITSTSFAPASTIGSADCEFSECWAGVSARLFGYKLQSELQCPTNYIGLSRGTLNCLE